MAQPLLGTFSIPLGQYLERTRLKAAADTKDRSSSFTSALLTGSWSSLLQSDLSEVKKKKEPSQSDEPQKLDEEEKIGTATTQQSLELPPVQKDSTASADPGSGLKFGLSVSFLYVRRFKYAIRARSSVCLLTRSQSCPYMNKTIRRAIRWRRILLILSRLDPVLAVNLHLDTMSSSAMTLKTADRSTTATTSINHLKRVSGLMSRLSMRLASREALEWMMIVCSQRYSARRRPLKYMSQR